MAENETILYEKGGSAVVLGVEYAPDRERILRGILFALGWPEADVDRVAPLVVNAPEEVDEAA